MPGSNAPYDKVNFIFEQELMNNLSGKMYDLAGGYIADLSRGVTPDSFSWDGTTGNGNIAPPGIYLYRISLQGGDAVTGTVVLAR